MVAMMVRVLVGALRAAVTLGVIGFLAVPRPPTTNPERDTMLETRHTSATATADLVTLLALNEEYVRAVETSDVRRFREILADDFLCTLSDGSHLDRDAFLEYAAEPPGISNLEVQDVNVRLMGDVAIVHGRTTFRMADGRAGASRYTDVWTRRDGRWLAVSAQVTRY